MGGCKVPKDNPGLSQGRPQRAASPSPTPCYLRYLIILTRPASPRLCQHKVKPAGNRRGNPRGREPRSCSRGCRSRWAGEAAAAAASAGSNTPSWSRCPGPCAFFAVHPGSPRALGAQLTHVPWPHVAAGFFQIRSQGAEGSQQWDLTLSRMGLELVPAAARTRDGREGAEHPWSKA